MHYDFSPRWFRPQTLEEALDLLDPGKENGLYILAGGTDLNVRIRDGQVLPAGIMDITGIGELSAIETRTWAEIRDSKGPVEYTGETIRQDGSFLRIGAAVTMDMLERSDIVKELFPALRKAAGEVGSPLIRNVATIGGNVMNASPAADVSTMLMALGSRAVFLSKKGGRVVPLSETFTGVCTTCIGEDELLASILIPVPSDPRGSGFYKLKKREALSLSLVNSGAVLESDGRRITGATLSVGAVAVTPLMIPKAREVLVGKGPAECEQYFASIARGAMELSRPITDVRGSAEYRKEMVAVCARHALEEAHGSLMKALGGSPGGAM